jgi:hypothetical protein
MVHISSDQKKVFYFSRTSPIPQLQYVGYIILVVAIVQGYNGDYTQAVFFFFIGLAILFLKSWTKLDVAKMTIVDFFSIVPYRTVKLEAIQKVVFTQGNVSQTMGSRGSTSTINYMEYKILLDTGGETIKLQTSKNRERLLKKAHLLAHAARTELSDQTI